MQQFTKLLVWQRAHQLTLAIYRLTATFPRSEQFGLTSQLRRAAVSVAANIVEGSKRLTERDFERFLNIAESSLAEVHYLLLLSRDLKLAELTTCDRLLDECNQIGGMLNRLRSKVGRSVGQRDSGRRR